MSKFYEYENKEGFLMAKPMGDPGTVTDFVSFAEAVLRETAARNYKCLLVDRRSSTLNLDVIDLVLISDMLDKMSLQNLGIRIALLGDVDNVTLFKALETSMTNRSFSYKFFVDYDAAVNWLLLTVDRNCLV